MAKIDGTNGNDTLLGTRFSDEIDGDAGRDILRGRGGNDRLDGDGGNDSLWGDDGNDSLEGDDGNDRLSGGAGRDRLEGGDGDDVLTGGRGADVFEFDRTDGNDRITDFRNGVDIIHLDDFTRAQVEAVIADARQDGDDVLLTLSGNTTVRIADMNLGQLDLGDFTF